MITKKVRNEWKKLGNEGMISALGEYTPTEFLDLLDFLDDIEIRVKLAYKFSQVGRFEVVSKELEKLKDKLS